MQNIVYIYIITKDSIPKTINALYLHDGFSQTLESFIHDNVNILHLFGIHSIIKSIPSCVGTVHLHHSFENAIEPGLLGVNINCIYFYGRNILKAGVLLSSVKEINFCNGFDQELEPNLMTLGLETIKFNNLKQPIQQNSIPASVTNIHFNDGFNQPLIEGVLGDSIVNLGIGNILTI